MANEPNENDKPESVGEIAAGIVDAVAQDVELAVEQIGDAARDVIVAVEKKLRRPKPAAKKPKATARKTPTKKPKPKARKTPAKKPKAKTRKVAKAKKRKRR
jgi:hypothetical protein